jgi:predicted ester cyclase
MQRRNVACPRYFVPPQTGPRRQPHCGDNTRAQHKLLVLRYYDEVLTRRRLDVLDELVAPGFVGHDPAGAIIDREGHLVAVKMLHAGFAQLRVRVDDQVAEDDRVTTRWTAIGTHTGAFAGIPATWREVTISGIDIHRLDGRRLVEHWEQLDLASLLAQLL